MKKLTENNSLESLAFCALIFLFAIQPVFGRIGVADDVVWVLMVVCIAVALFGFVRHVRTEGAAYWDLSSVIVSIRSWLPSG